MGLHPSIRSLLAANAGFTTGNVTSRQKQSLSLSPEMKQFFMLAEPGRGEPLFPGAEGARPASTCSLPAPGAAARPPPAQVAPTPALLALLPGTQETAALKGSINIKRVIPVINGPLPTQWAVF